MKRIYKPFPKYTCVNCDYFEMTDDPMIYYCKKLDKVIEPKNHCNFFYRRDEKGGNTNKNQLRKELNILLKEQREILDKNERLERKIKELSEKINKPKREDGEMYLEVNTNNTLLIKIMGYNDVLFENDAGYITYNGECCILSSIHQHKAWEYWAEHEMKFDSTPVEWKGKNYLIKREADGIWLKNTVNYRGIYDFFNGIPLKSDDKNIQRLSHGRVKIF